MGQSGNYVFASTTKCMWVAARSGEWVMLACVRARRCDATRCVVERLVPYITQQWWWSYIIKTLFNILHSFAARRFTVNLEFAYLSYHVHAYVYLYLCGFSHVCAWWSLALLFLKARIQTMLCIILSSNVCFMVNMHFGGCKLQPLQMLAEIYFAVERETHCESYRAF